MFLKNKYSKWYFKIVENASKRIITDGYTEIHHIVPKSMGGNNSSDNLVVLTAKEHFVCHLLLVKAVESLYKKKMNFAYWRMCNITKNRYVPTSRQYEIGKLLFIESHMGHKPYLLSHTDETKLKISKTMSSKLSVLSDNEKRERVLNSCCKPESYTTERNRNISIARTGYKDTDEAKINKSIAARNRDNSHLLQNAKINKGRTWKLINGKRVWLDKEN